MTNLVNLRIPPHSPEAETCFLCAVLERNSLIDDVDGIICASDFYRHENQIVFTRMAAMAMQSQPIDPVTLWSNLERSGEDSQVSPDYIIEIATSGRGAHNAIHYANIIRDKSIDRQLIRKGYEITEIGYSDGDAQEKIDQAQSLIMQSAAESSGEAAHINVGLQELIARVEKNYANKGAITGVETGYAELDKLLYGLQDTDMIVVAARPSMGKTTLAMNIAESAVVRQKKNVLVFSLEMSRPQLLERMACSIGKIPHDKLKRAEMDDYWPNFTAAVAKLKDSTLHIDDRAITTSEQLISRTRKIQKRIGSKIELIVIDYLQILKDKGEGVERVTKISGNIKALAKEINCPVIAISQLSRKCEERPNKRPLNSDLRDSGAIEQDADVIAFIYRDEVYNPETTREKGIAEIIVSKHRNGEIGVIRLASNLRFSRFENLEASRLAQLDQESREHQSKPQKADAFAFLDR